MSMLINSYNNPIITHWELDSRGDKVSVQVLNERATVVEGAITLMGLPDYNYRVYIDNMEEIEIDEEIKEPHQFKVDYRHSGVIFFHPDMEGKSILVNRYYSKGVVYYPASRVWTKVDSMGKVIETLDEVVAKIPYIHEVFERLDETIEEGHNTVEEIKLTEKDARDVEESLKKTTIDGRVATKELQDMIGLADNVNTDLKESTTKAKDVDSKLKETTRVGEDVNNRLQTTVDKSDANIEELHSSIGKSNANIITLEDLMEFGLEFHLKLTQDIEKGEDVNITLVNSTQEAIEKNDTLRETIIISKDVEDHLNNIIEGSDLEVLINKVATVEKKLNTPVIKKVIENKPLTWGDLCGE